MLNVNEKNLIRQRYTRTHSVNFGECENDSNVREIMLAARTILVNPKLLSRVRIRTRSRFYRAEINPADPWS